MSLVRACALLLSDYEDLIALAPTYDWGSESSLDVALFEDEDVGTEDILERLTLKKISELFYFADVDPSPSPRKASKIKKLLHHSNDKIITPDNMRLVDRSARDLRDFADSHRIPLSNRKTKIRMQVDILRSLALTSSGTRSLVGGPTGDTDQSSAGDTYVMLGGPQSTLPKKFVDLKDRLKPLGYTLEEPLGKGGFGLAFLCQDIRLESKVVLKLLRSGNDRRDDASLKRILREARLARQVRSNHVVTIYSILDEIPAIVMEYCDSGSLQDILEKSKGQPRLPVPKVLKVWTHISRAIRDIELKGIVHRDIGPHNIFIAKDETAKDGDEVYRLGDFGISTSRPLGNNTVMGRHPIWYAPEISQKGAVDSRYDVFTLGKTILACLLGVDRVESYDPETNLDDQTDLMPDVRGYIGPKLAELLQHMLAADPVDRPRPVDLLQQLERLTKF